MFQTVFLMTQLFYLTHVLFVNKNWTPGAHSEI